MHSYLFDIRYYGTEYLIVFMFGANYLELQWVKGDWKTLFFKTDNPYLIAGVGNILSIKS